MTQDGSIHKQVTKLYSNKVVNKFFKYFPKNWQKRNRAVINFQIFSFFLSAGTALAHFHTSGNTLFLKQFVKIILSRVTNEASFIWIRRPQARALFRSRDLIIASIFFSEIATSFIMAEVTVVSSRGSSLPVVIHPRVR